MKFACNDVKRTRYNHDVEPFMLLLTGMCYSDENDLNPKTNKQVKSIFRSMSSMLIVKLNLKIRAET